VSSVTVLAASRIACRTDARICSESWSVTVRLLRAALDQRAGSEHVANRLRDVDNGEGRALGVLAALAYLADSNFARTGKRRQKKS
jgi:hypothetical protein